MNSLATGGWAVALTLGSLGLDWWASEAKWSFDVGAAFVGALVFLVLALWAQKTRNSLIQRIKNESKGG